MPKTPSPFARTRSAPSPLKAAKRTSISHKSSRTTEEEKLDDTGIVPSLAARDVAQDVKSLVRHTQSRMWTDVPDRAAGMGSERIAEVLRFRQMLPPIVSVAHLHALSVNSTETERKMALLVAQSVVRKVLIPGRGKGGAAVGEGIVLAEDWRENVMRNEKLEDELKSKYSQLLKDNPGSSAAPTSALSSAEVQILVQAGYLVSPSALSAGAPANPASLNPLSYPGSKAATGTLAAVGGTGAVHESGGGGSTLASSADRTPGKLFQHNMRTMTFSLPATGAYLKLLTTARLHLLALLKQLSPRHKEATIDMLKEKWDGNVPNDAASAAKRARGKWSGVLPGKTRKWREFYGLEFEWVLEECVGSGLVELFDTGSVGFAVRAT